MRKLIFTVAGLLLLSISTFAQVKKEFSASGVKTLHLVVDDADITITGGASGQIILHSNDVPPIPERAKGLKPLYNNATDNTGAGMQVTKEGDVLVLKKARSYDANYELKIPAGMNVIIDETNWTGGQYMISNVSGEIEVNSKNAYVKLEKVSGPVTASSTSGDIEVIFNSMNQSKPTFISNISGAIDVTIGSSKANLNISSITGEVYSSYDLSKSKDGMSSYGRSKIEAPVNGGGVEVKLKNISGDIFVRN